jgi:hypothetical protein
MFFAFSHMLVIAESLFQSFCTRQLQHAKAFLYRFVTRQENRNRFKAGSYDVSSKSFTVPAAPEKITACERCVYGSGQHAPGARREELKFRRPGVQGRGTL